MKIITKTTFIIDKGKNIEPGKPIDLDDDEALSLIERGLAESESVAEQVEDVGEQSEK